MPPSTETEKRLCRLEEKAEAADSRLDDLYRLVGQLAVHEADAVNPVSGPTTSYNHPDRRWYDDIPVKWVTLWACGIVTLILATYGLIRSDMLTDFWHLLAGGGGTP